LKLIKRLNVKPFYNNLYPNFQQYIPGLVPASPSSEMLTDLVHILEQTIWVGRNAEIHGMAFIHSDQDDEDDYYVRACDSAGGRHIWKEQKIAVSRDFEPIKLTFGSDILESFKKLPPHLEILQLALTPLPLPIKETGKPNYFPVAFLMVNARNGYVEMYETLTPFPSFHEMVAELPNIVMRQCLKLGWRPARVKIRDFHLTPLVSFFNKYAIAKTWHSFNLEKVDEALIDLVENIGKSL